MKIKVSDLSMAFDESSPEEAASRIAKQFGVLVEIERPNGGGGGWPAVSLIGTPHQIWTALTATGGWSCGDAEEDAEVAYGYLRAATLVFG